MAEHCRTAIAQSLVHTLEGKAPLRPPACLGGNYVFSPKLYEPSCQSDPQEIRLGRGEEEEWVGEHRIWFQERDRGVKGVRTGTKRYVETSSWKKNEK